MKRILSLLLAACMLLLFSVPAAAAGPRPGAVVELYSAEGVYTDSVGNTTSSLSGGGRAAIMVAMFCGRLGALSVVMMIGDRESKRRIRFPQEELVVG